MYEEDFYLWTKTQSELLKKGDIRQLDLLKLSEELEDLGSSKENAIEIHLTVILIHMLKLKCQPEFKTRSWENSIKNSKFQIEKIMKKNPSLKKFPSLCLEDAYQSSRYKASSETNMDLKFFPKKCPWKIEEIL